MLAILLLLVAVQANGAAAPRGEDGQGGKDARPPAADLERALAAADDLWGEASLREPGGPSVDFFEKLLPPLRYVNTDFRHYPIVLGRLGASVKARFVSNGSGVNLLAGIDTWHDAGLVPVEFLVCNATIGRAFSRFGEDLSQLDGPRYAEGFLPIVELTHRAGGIAVAQEAFASVAPPLDRDDAALFVRFSNRGDVRAMVAARIGSDAQNGMTARGRLVCDATGRAVVAFGSDWTWDEKAQRLIADLAEGKSTELVVFTRGSVVDAGAPPFELDGARYDAERARCADAWRDVIDGCTKLVTGERRVDDAWRALVVGTLLLADGDTLEYSAGNLYEQTFEAECGDAVRALLALRVPGAERFVEPLLARPLQSGIELSDVSYKLQLLAWQHELLRDDAKTRAALPLVLPQADAALAQIEAATGLVPAQAYFGDIGTKVHNLYANAAFWRGLRDVARVLRALGGGASSRSAELEHAARFETAAVRLKESVLAAVAKSERTDVTPPFIPIALFGAEAPYELLTQTKQGAYWNLIAPYVEESAIFGPGSPRTQAMIDWQLHRGGVCMGMVRFHQHSGLFANEDGLDDLYTFRLTEELLRRDDVDRALVSFYGKLAQGMTRDTCIGCEGSGLRPLDAHGRAMYLPPNCSANAFFLWTLRHLLVQEVREPAADRGGGESNGDGAPDTLRLLFATPRRWLADGAHLELKRAPTKFGELSLDVRCDLAHRRVDVALELPPRVPRKSLLRLRLPEGWRIERASAGETELPLAAPETLDLAGRQGRVDVVVTAQALPRAR